MAVEPSPVWVAKRQTNSDPEREYAVLLKSVNYPVLALTREELTQLIADAHAALEGR